MLSPEVKENLAKSKERLKAAGVLFDARLFDDAASRAYYATLYAAQAALITQNLVAKSHDGVVLLFGSTFIKTGRTPRSIGTDLSRLRRMREKAEYSSAFKTTEADAAWAVNAAKRFVAEIEKILG